VAFNAPSILNTTEAGGTATFTARLTSMPSGDVSFDLSSSDATEGSVEPASLTFTPANWNVPQTVTVRSAEDADAVGVVDHEEPRRPLDEAGERGQRRGSQGRYGTQLCRLNRLGAAPARRGTGWRRRRLGAAHPRLGLEARERARRLLPKLGLLQGHATTLRL